MGRRAGCYGIRGAEPVACAGTCVRGPGGLAPTSTGLDRFGLGGHRARGAGAACPHRDGRSPGLRDGLGFGGVVWLSGHMMQIVNLATAVIAVRVFVAYIEVFGSMLATGAGLIVSGVLLLALAWVWVRKIRLQPGGAA